MASLTAVGLGVLAGVMMVVGHQRWDGAVVLAVSDTHGLHRGDIAALVPVVVGALLARWCWRQGSPS